MPKKIVRDPIYQQLNQALCEIIESGVYNPGDRFLTERQISEVYGVSRATANKALSSLVSQGILEFRKGIGTFIQGHTRTHDLFDDKAKEANKQPATRVLDFRNLKASEAEESIRENLKVGPDEPLYFVERLRLLDDVPVLLERRHIVAKFCPNLKKEALLGSLYETWASEYDLEITESDERIRAVSIGRQDAKFLQVPTGTAGMQVIGSGRLKGGDWLYLSQTLYRGDMYEFRKHQTFSPRPRFENAFVLDLQITS